jgi:Mn2+/Fe2+ NRAMP family transporter
MSEILSESPTKVGRATLRTKPNYGVLTGAAFLMATSAIGPGFLTQTTQFTSQLGASLAFAILASVVIDIGAQLNTWRVVCVSRLRGQEVVGAVIPALRWVVIAVILFGSFVFNIGNLSGCALALQVLLKAPPVWGVIGSAAVAAVLFLQPRMSTAMDWFAKVLGAVMILIAVYMIYATKPPLLEPLRQSVWPDKLDFGVIVTLVGGTVGGYIMFSGSHRLLDAGIGGQEQLAHITWASVLGVVITGVTRVLVFLAVLGVVTTGAVIGGTQPVFDAFRSGAGSLGEVLAGLIFWAASITSVVGCSYTAVSFLGSGIPNERQQGRRIVGFVASSLAAMLVLMHLQVQPTRLLIAAGTINGILLPILIAMVLWVAYKPKIMGDYRHPLWVGALGLMSLLISLFLAYRVVVAL